MKITDEMIDNAMKLGACKEALQWLRREPRTVEDLIEDRRFVGWCFAYGLVPDEYIDRCAAISPHDALMEVPDKIGDECFIECVKVAPYEAIRYAADRLTAAQLNQCILEMPLCALLYAPDRLSKEQVAWCVATREAEALMYASERLSDEQFVACATSYPDVAINADPTRFTRLGLTVPQ